MKRIKKIVLSIIISIFLLISVSGCTQKTVYIKPQMPILKEYKVPKLEGVDYEIREKVK